MGEALRNPFLLNQIFTYLSTKDLLSSCRPVSKTVCKEASRLLHNPRECIAVQKRGQSLCEFLRGFSQLATEMAGKERIWMIPFNGLKIRVCSSKKGCQVSTGPELLPEAGFMDNLDLKYIHVRTEREDSDCHVHYPLAALLCYKGKQLKTLKFSGRPLLFAEMWGPREIDSSSFLPQLDILDISRLNRHEEEQGFEEEEEQAVKKLLDAAPNLKQIIASDIMKLVPLDMLQSLLELQDDFDFRMELNEDLDLLNTVSMKDSPRIKKMSIYVPPFDEQTEELFDPEDEEVDMQQRRAFDQPCERMRRNCRSALEELCIYGVFPLGESLCLSPLPNVSKLMVTKRYAEEMEQLWDSIRTIGFESALLGSKKVEICIQASFESPRAQSMS